VRPAIDVLVPVEGSVVALDVGGLIVSLAVLALTGDQFIVTVARIAGILGWRPTVVGALVGGFGTSIAELIVAALATLRASPQLAVGSLVGSIIANVCLALAVAALITPVRVDSGTVRREAPLSVASVALFAVLAVGGVSRTAGVVMLVALVPVVVLLLVSARRRGPEDELGTEVVEFFQAPARRPRSEIARALVSLTFMLGGAELLVTSVVGLAARLGLEEGFAGLTLVGIGTSAPLIASSIQAARRGEHDLVVGNVLGGNLFIALGGGALVGLLSRGEVGGVGAFSLWLMTGVVVVSWLAMGRKGVLARWEALLLLLAYAAVLPIVNR
jgi:cation:H+ antiporter